jgi:hypothetical protein
VRWVFCFEYDLLSAVSGERATKVLAILCDNVVAQLSCTKEIDMSASTLSFRAGEDFVEQTRASALIAGMKSSDYLRLAVAEMNKRVMAQRIAALSKELSAENLALNESLNDSLTDGLED